MKRKLILLLTLMLLVTGCNKKEIKEDKKEEKEEIVVVEDKNTEEQIEKIEKEIPIGAYINGVIQKDYYDPYIKFTDIAVFNTFLSNDEVLTTPYLKYSWTNYYNNDLELKEYKIGYKIKFSIPDRDFDYYIFRPGDVLGYFNYIQVYLYDDYNQADGAFYSHIEDSEYNDNTLMTSIKLTASVYIEEVSNEIELTTFIYKPEEIVNGEYIGNNKFTTILHRT